MKQFLFAAAAADAAPNTPVASTPAASTPPPASTTTAVQNTPTSVTETQNAGATETQLTAASDTQATETQPTDQGTAPAQKQSQGGGFGMWVPMLLIFAIFYFLMIKPQQRKEKERRKMISELRAGTKVVFAGGLIGTIVEAKELTFKIEIAGDVVIEVARSAVQGLAVEDKPADATGEPAKK